jgi:glyoxylase-like metal-dependent hydrolase (beta-lactamase superfamily II)
MVHIIPDSGFARTYLIEEDDGLMAVNVGSIGAAREIESYCSDVLGKSLRDIRFIAATHFHIDHIGGIGTLLKKCSPETNVLFHLLAKDYVEGKANLAPMRNWLSGLVPTIIRENYSGIGNLSHVSFESFAGFPLPGFRTMERVPYADRVSYIDMQAALLSRTEFSDREVISTPGHTPDSFSLYNWKTRELFCGYLILGKNDDTGCLNRFCWDEGLALDSFAMLKNIFSVRKIYPGHGNVIQDDEDAFAKVDSFTRNGSRKS